MSPSGEAEVSVPPPVAETPPAETAPEVPSAPAAPPAEAAPAVVLSGAAAELEHRVAIPILKEAAQLLLEARDLRAILPMLALQTNDSPLAQELVADTLRMIGSLKPGEVPLDRRVHWIGRGGRLTKLQEQIGQLHLPETTQTGALVSFLKDNHVSASLVDQVAATGAGSGEVVRELLGHEELGPKLWSSIRGGETSPQPPASPAELLVGAKLASTGNIKALQESMYATLPRLTRLKAGAGKIFNSQTMMIGMIAASFITSLFAEADQSGRRPMMAH